MELFSFSVFATLVTFYIPIGVDGHRVFVMAIKFDSHQAVAMFDNTKNIWRLPAGTVKSGQTPEEAAKSYTSVYAGVSGDVYILDKIADYRATAADPTKRDSIYFYLMDVKKIDAQWPLDKHIERLFASLPEIMKFYREDVDNNSLFWQQVQIFLNRSAPYDGVGILCTVPYTEQYLMLENVETKEMKFPSDVVLPQDGQNMDSTAARIAVHVAGVVPETIKFISLYVNNTTNAAHLIFFIPLYTIMDKWQDSELYARRWVSSSELSPYIGGNERIPSYAFRISMHVMRNLLRKLAEKIEIICVDFVNSRVLALDTDLWPDTWGVPLDDWVCNENAMPKRHIIANTAFNYGGVKGKVYCLDNDLYLMEVKEIRRYWPIMHACRERKWLTFEEVAPKVSSLRVKKLLRVFLRRGPNRLPFDDVSLVCFKSSPTNVIVLQSKKENQKNWSKYYYPRGEITSTDEDKFISSIAELAKEEAGIEGTITPLGLHFMDLGDDRYRILLICTVRYKSDIEGWQTPFRKKVWIPGKDAFEYFQINPKKSFLMRVLKNVLGV